MLDNLLANVELALRRFGKSSAQYMVAIAAYQRELGKTLVNVA